MTGRLGKNTGTLFIPPPVDGLNLVDAPYVLKPTEARLLDNYVIYDSGIQQVPGLTLNKAHPSELYTLIPYRSNLGAERMLAVDVSKIWRYDSPTSTTPTDITGAVGGGFYNWCLFNKHLFFFTTGGALPYSFDLADGSNAVASGITGPGVGEYPVTGTGYKNRLYMLSLNSRKVWYGNVGQITGAFTGTVDFSEILQTSGQINTIFTWTFNQGLENEELFCILSDTGEILIYAGDYPGAANWELVGRAFAPEPKGGSRHLIFCKVSGDVYLFTKRGIISLASLVSGNDDASYYTISRRIKDGVNSTVTSALSPTVPFMFVADSTEQNIFCLNYERGAWSKIKLPNWSTFEVRALAIFGGYLMIATYLDFKSVYNVPLSAGSASASLEYNWATPYFDFGEALIQKSSKLLRVVGKNVNNAGTFYNAVRTAVDLDPSGAPQNFDTQQTSVPADSSTVQELRPPGTGYRISYFFTRTGTVTTNELNQIQGFEVLYELGGVY